LGVVEGRLVGRQLRLSGLVGRDLRLILVHIRLVGGHGLLCVRALWLRRRRLRRGAVLIDELLVGFQLVLVGLQLRRVGGGAAGSVLVVVHRRLCIGDRRLVDLLLRRELCLRRGQRRLGRIDRRLRARLCLTQGRCGDVDGGRSRRLGVV